MTVAEETIARETIRLMRERGTASYFGEPVSQMEHALQAAFLAREEGCEPESIVAALLHDVGHLLHDLPEDVADEGVDTRHEDAGYEWLVSRFGPAVANTVRQHVAAKRYLCAVDPGYLARLSPTSVQSLALQGGPFSPDEVREFETLPCWREALRLRRWDDAAKVAGLEVPDIEEYADALRSVAQPRGSASASASPSTGS